MSRAEYDYKRSAIKAARELGYNEKYIQRLKSASSEIEIEQILVSARKEQR